MTILEEAAAITHVDRQQDYGHPYDNWTATATIFTGILQAAGVLREGAAVSAEVAALLMVGVKCAREAHKPKRDNRVDTAGYAEVVDQIATERERRNAPEA